MSEERDKPKLDSKVLDGRVLDRLFTVVASRRDADPKKSYSAKLFRRGPAKIAQKVGEEAVEAAIEIVRGDRAALALESADLLYHLTLSWAALGLTPAEVWEKLELRAGRSGLEREEQDD